MSWLEETPSGHALRVAAVEEGGVVRPRTVVEAADLFVNWADVPSVTVASDGRWIAHYLQRGGGGTYDYRILVATSDDGGRTWSSPTVPHTDTTPTEHGFVTVLPRAAGAATFVWLDGRRFVDGPGGPATEEMTLRRRTLSAAGVWGEEEVVDELVCDCCQTAGARTRGGWVVAYRDRTRGEVRDIHTARIDDAGRWIPGGAVHADGWVISGCPVNGPAVGARGDTVAVAWFTAADDEPRVHLAVSRDGGATFADPVRIDQGDPVGRVDVVVDEAGGAWVLWMEGAGEGAELRLRRVGAEGTPGRWHALTATARARSAGFPRIVAWPGGGLVMAWTEPRARGDGRDPGGNPPPPRVRLAHLTLPDGERSGAVGEGEPGAR
jgi:hypothetical protein